MVEQNDKDRMTKGPKERRTERQNDRQTSEIQGIGPKIDIHYERQTSRHAAKKTDAYTIRKNQETDKDRLTHIGRHLVCLRHYRHIDSGINLKRVYRHINSFKGLLF